MTFYHGSSTGNLTQLLPFLSEHGRPYIYFASNPLVALLYAVKPVPKPFSFYPYGFDENGILVFNEYYENAFFDIYKGQKGYLYECYHLPNIENATQINCAYTCTEPVEPDDVSEICDLYEYYKKQEANGQFRIKTKQEISESEMHFVYSELKKDIDKHNLKANPEHAMSLFIQTHFPDVWQTKPSMQA